MFFYHAVRERYADPLSDRCGGPPFSTPRSPMWPRGVRRPRQEWRTPPRIPLPPPPMDTLDVGKVLPPLHGGLYLWPRGDEPLDRPWAFAAMDRWPKSLGQSHPDWMTVCVMSGRPSRTSRVSPSPVI